MLTITVFEILLFEDLASVLGSTQRIGGSERINEVKAKNNAPFFMDRL